MTSPTVSRPDQSSSEIQVGTGSTSGNGHGNPDAHAARAVAGSTFPQATHPSNPNALPPEGSFSRPDHSTPGTHMGIVGAGTNLPQAKVVPKSIVVPPEGYFSSSSHHGLDTHLSSAVAGSISRPDQELFDSHDPTVGAGSTSGNGHACHDTQTGSAVAGTTLPQSNVSPIPIKAPTEGTISSNDHRPVAIQTVYAVAGLPFPADHKLHEVQSAPVGGESHSRSGGEATNPLPLPIESTSLSSPLLSLAAEVLDDTERTRISNENRLRQLTRSVEDSDGESRGFGLDKSHPDVGGLAALVQMMKCNSVVVLALGIPKPKKERGKPCCFEHAAELNLNSLLRQHPLYPWIKAQKGVGPKQAARLLAVIGDPYVNETTGEVRTVSQLRSYCGHGDSARKRAKGMSQADLFTLGNPVAKSRLWLISCAVLKSQGPLSEVYYSRKAATEGREHVEECRRCGPSGNPALPGSVWSDGHRHADALRVTGKEILKGLWCEAKRLHEEEIKK